MSAQPKRADDLRITEDWQVTPVIIKSGGGPVDPEGKVACSIEDFGQSFRSSLMDHKWESAKSSGTGRIVSLEIKDGDKTLPLINADGAGLTDVQVSFGNETLIVQELALPNSDFTDLNISSSLPFEVTKGGLQPDEWKRARTEVPADPPFIVFTQGDRMHKRYCTSTDVELTLSIDWDEAV